MYQYCNLNPRGLRVGDCVVRAIAKATNESWENVYFGLTIQGYLMGDLLSSNAVWDKYLKTRGFKREMIPSDYPECYCIEDFAYDHSQGVYIVGTGTHATAIADGVIYDIWDCSQERPMYFYHKEK